MAHIIHFGVDPRIFYIVRSCIPGAETIADSWSVWGEPLNTVYDEPIDTLHVTVPGDDVGTLLHALHVNKIALEPMGADEHHQPGTGTFVVVSDAEDYAEDQTSYDHADLASWFADKVAMSDAFYFDPDTLDPITAEWLDQHVHDQDVLDAALADREILNRPGAYALAKNMDKTRPYAK